MKMWAGRFSKETDSSVNDFNSSLSFDSRMYKEDITGSMAHAQMLGKCGIIEQSEADKIIEGLRGILSDIEKGKLSLESDAEDIHMFVEQILTERIGDTGKRLHTARSRNDQVAVDTRLYLRNQISEIADGVLDLIDAIIDTASAHTQTVMPGYTHLQRAQPVTYAHYILAYAQMLTRDVSRLRDAAKRMNYMPLGSGALATTTYPINRFMTAELLGFDGPCENSMDGVSDRDFVIETASALSIIMMHLSRFSEEIILWCSSEFGFADLDDAFSTGSSIMPQKKNPDVAELVRGKTGRVYGSLVTLLTVMKALPLAYNKDMQEDKEAIFDALDNVKLSLYVFTKMFATLTVRPQVMLESAAKGYMNATDCADYLTKKGLPFRDAYKISGGLVRYCVECGKSLDQLTLGEFKSASEVFEDDIYQAIDLKNCVNGRSAYGGPSEKAVEVQISNLRAFVEKERKN